MLCLVYLSWVILSLDCPILITTSVFSSMHLQNCDSYVHSQLLKINYNNKLSWTSVCQYHDKNQNQNTTDNLICWVILAPRIIRDRAKRFQNETEVY